MPWKTIFGIRKYVTCNGLTELYGEKFHCWKKKGHGPMNMRSAIQRSCDVYFYEVARQLGVDRLSETAKNLDWEKSLENLVEEDLVSSKYKMEKKVYRKNWYLGETLHSGIGQ